MLTHQDIHAVFIKVRLCSKIHMTFQQFSHSALVELCESFSLSIRTDLFSSTMIDSSEVHSLICQLSEKLPNKSSLVLQQWKSACKFVQSLNFKWDPSRKSCYESWNFIKSASNRNHSASLYSGACLNTIIIK